LLSANEPLKQVEDSPYIAIQIKSLLNRVCVHFHSLREMPSSPDLAHVEALQSLVHNSGTYLVRIRENVLVLPFALHVGSDRGKGNALIRGQSGFAL